MLLENKIAVVYGAGSALGGAVARAFARERAYVFLAERDMAALEPVASRIAEAGGVAEVAAVDPLDPRAVRAHIDEVTSWAGGPHILFNAVPLPRTTSTALVDASVTELVDALNRQVAAQLITAQAAARQMTRSGSGVILTVSGTAWTGGGTTGQDGAGLGDTVVEAMSDRLARELGDRGVRVVCLRSGMLAAPPAATGASGARARSPLDVDLAAAAETILLAAAGRG
ncbi:SDR family oxidoreductase [Actinoalloteichus caeruleus]|uniref:SDR family oxidoreductase n=1 Tax=Actinoalloteichus cyanogriseus TaxID=2893586 RepID=UPI003AAF74FB